MNPINIVQKWIAGIALAALLAAGGYVWFQLGQLDKLKADKAALELAVKDRDATIGKIQEGQSIITEVRTKQNEDRKVIAASVNTQYDGLLDYLKRAEVAAVTSASGTGIQGQGTAPEASRNDEEVNRRIAAISATEIAVKELAALVLEAAQAHEDFAKAQRDYEK